MMGKPRVSQVPESMLFDSIDECFKAMPADPAVPMVGVYDYDLLQAQCEKLAGALEDDICHDMYVGKKLKQALADYRKAFPKEES